MQLMVEREFEQGAEPAFLIRGRVVPYSEALRYFHRKGIQDPLSWIKGLPNKNFTRSRDVELLTPHSTDQTPDSTDEDEGISQDVRQPSTEERGSRSVSDATDIEIEGFNHLQLFQPLRLHQCAGAEKIIYSTNEYCILYLNSARSLEHKEPAVHHLTTHAIFAQRMQDGISLLLRNETTSAFTDFKRAFALVPDLLRDNHLMSISLLLSIVCDLDSRNFSTGNFGSLIFYLFRHIEEMSAVELGVSHPLTTLFKTLTHSEGDATNLSLLVVRRAVDYLTASSSSSSSTSGANTDWKALYLRERLCDCLYYSHHDDERRRRRRALLTDQERFYGTTSRNVLWTLMNVADDNLQLGRTQEARECFEKALVRAQALSGYGKSKTRFAALEGLGRCEVMEAKCLEVYSRFAGYDARPSITVPASTDTTSGVAADCLTTATTSGTVGAAAAATAVGAGTSPTSPWRPKLEEALRLFKEAETDAKIWFEASSRRISRVQASIREVEGLIMT
jgi:tetratricopeptide (TPR) repeat protein